MCSYLPRFAPLQLCPSLQELTMCLICWACKSHRVSYPASLKRGKLSSHTHQILGMTFVRTRSTCGQIWKRQTCQFQQHRTTLMIQRAPATTTLWARLSSMPLSIFHCRKKALMQELYSRYTCPPSMGFQPADTNEDPLPEASFTCGSDGSWARDPPAAQQGSIELPACVCECWRHCPSSQEQRTIWWEPFFQGLIVTEWNWTRPFSSLATLRLGTESLPWKWGRASNSSVPMSPGTILFSNFLPSIGYHSMWCRLMSNPSEDIAGEAVIKATCIGGDQWRPNTTDGTWPYLCTNSEAFEYFFHMLSLRLFLT